MTFLMIAHTDKLCSGLGNSNPKSELNPKSFRRSSVDVQHLASGVVFVFPCGRWIDRWCGYERVLWADPAAADRVMRRRARQRMRDPTF